MSSYFIFVLVLTVGYVIYYAIMVALDLKRKPDEGKDNTEVIDVSSSFEPEESISVTESEDGFSIGDNDYKSTIAPQPIEEQRKEEVAKQAAAREKLQSINGKMERQRVSLSKPMYSDEYNAALLAAKHGNSVCQVTLHENWTDARPKSAEPINEPTKEETI